MIKDNLVLCVGRAGQVVGAEKPWNVVFCSNHMEDLNLFYRGGSSNFPLYLYPDTERQNLFNDHEQATDKQPNINPEILAQLSGIYPELPSPEMIFYYIYAVLYSETYRKKYAEFLRIDFPRIPFTKDFDLFRRMAEYGQWLVDLHLMNAPDLDSPMARFQGPGDERVDKLRYDHKDNRIYINKDQYFENIAEDIWQYQIGGYQVCNKWLKDRKGKTLSLSDVKHYCKIVTAISNTLEIQRSINKEYPNIEETSS